MKFTVFIFSLFIIFDAYSKEYSKIYQSFDSDYEATVIVSPYNSKNQYLIAFQGFEQPEHNRTGLYQKVKNDIGNGVHYRLAGMNTINLVNENNKTLMYGTLVPYYTVYLGDSSVTNVAYTGKGDIQTERKMQSKYEERQGLLTSKVAAKKRIRSSVINLSEKCQHNFKINIDWNSFEESGQKTTPGMLYSYLNALGKICEIDDDYLSAIQSINTINVKLSVNRGKHSANLEGDNLLLELDKEVPNISENSYQTIFNIL